MPYTGCDNGCNELLFPLDRISFFVPVSEKKLSNLKGSQMLICILFLTLLAGVVGLMVFLHFLRKGQFEDMEETKYQLFREDNDA